MSEIYGRNRSLKRIVQYRGKPVAIEGVDLRTLGAPNWLARKSEQRMAEQVVQAEFRAKALLRASAAMDPDEDRQRRAKAALIDEQLEDEEDDIGELTDHERDLIRTLRQINAKQIS